MARMRVSVPLPLGEALVLRELLRRYHESERPELRTDRAEWRVLVNLLGELERRLSGTADDARNNAKALAAARRRLGESEAPF